LIFQGERIDLCYFLLPDTASIISASIIVLLQS
jgi:hypothetical protein